MSLCFGLSCVMFLSSVELSVCEMSVSVGSVWPKNVVHGRLASVYKVLPRYTLFFETVFTQIVLFLSGGLLVQPLEIRGNFGQLLFREHCFWDFFFLFHKWWIKTSPLGLWLYLGCWVVSMEPPLGCIHSGTSRSLALLEVIAAVDL